jgi:protein-L-isoaspartate(D-aspartate) O-methyltransferase
MIARQLRARGIQDERVLAAMTRVPREGFVAVGSVKEAYGDHPLPIGWSQTISQPYVVAFMTEALVLRSSDRVLEIGTGSGYQTAVLAELAERVFSIEIVPELAQRAEQALRSLGYANVETRTGDGFGGWPEAAPFDAILLTAAPGRLPAPLLGQLAVGGRLVAPVGRDDHQELVRLVRLPDGSFGEEQLLPVRFVPMTGRASES